METKFETITVTTESGRQMEAQVIDIIEIPEFNKQYIFYTLFHITTHYSIFYYNIKKISITYLFLII